jgi:hypothetical protein
MELFNHDLGVLVKYMRGELPAEQQRMIGKQLHDDELHESVVENMDAMMMMNHLTLDDDTEVITQVLDDSYRRILKSMEDGYDRAVTDYKIELDIAILEEKMANDFETIGGTLDLVQSVCQGSRENDTMIIIVSPNITATMKRAKRRVVLIKGILLRNKFFVSKVFSKKRLEKRTNISP